MMWITVAKCLFPVLLLGGAFCAGYYTGAQPPEIQLVETTKVKTEYVYRDYKKLSPEEKDDELKAYDTGPFTIEATMNRSALDRAKIGFQVDAILHKRKAERTFYYSIGEDTYFKYYIGGLIGAGITYGSYRLYRHFKD